MNPVGVVFVAFIGKIPLLSGKKQGRLAKGHVAPW